MSEGKYSWTLSNLVLGGGPTHFVLHALTFGIAAYIIVRALTAYWRRTRLPTACFVVLSFFPLITASFGVYSCLVFMRAVYFATGLVDPGALPAGLASARLFLYSGWLCTALSLVSVYLFSRCKTAL